LICAGSATAAGSNVWGVGIATKLGHTVAVFSGVAEASVRFNKIEIAAGVMNGSDSIRDNVDGSSYTGALEHPIDSATVDQHSTSLLLKLHPMNGGFYFGFGGIQTEEKGRLRVSTIEDANMFLNERMELKTTFATISIGNIWTPGNVMIGVEWAAHHAKVSSSESIQSNSSDSLDPELIDMKSKFQSRVRRGPVWRDTSFRVLHLGYMLGS
jgi:hypothetical protein